MPTKLPTTYKKKKKIISVSVPALPAYQEFNFSGVEALIAQVS